jgi:hypothetical protein
MAKSRLFWPTREEARERQELIDEMMQVRGVDAAAAAKVDGGLAFLEAIGKCRLCGNEGACRHWLAGEVDSAPQEFCANADFFSTLLKKPD